MWIRFILKCLMLFKSSLSIIAVGIAIYSLYHNFRMKSDIIEYQRQLDEYKKKNTS